MLWQLHECNLPKESINVLDFSPSMCIFRKQKETNHNYVASDLSGDFLSDVSYDITKIDANDNSFDLIVCYHILEHVVEDGKAIKELYRVLKPKGKCIIQTPFREGDIYEDFL